MCNRVEFEELNGLSFLDPVRDQPTLSLPPRTRAARRAGEGVRVIAGGRKRCRSDEFQLRVSSQNVAQKTDGTACVVHTTAWEVFDEWPTTADADADTRDARRPDALTRDDPDATAYVEQHKASIEALLTSAVDALIAARPPDPSAFLACHLPAVARQPASSAARPPPPPTPA